MTDATTTAVRRPSLGLCVEGLAPREVLLLKSLVRLLDHRTQHQWTFHAERCDLLIAGDGLSRLAAVSGEVARDEPPSAVLRAGRAGAGVHELNLPLNPDALEQALNRAGTAIVDARRLAEARAAVPISDDERAFQLTRWPPSDLLRGPGRLALATLLVSRPCTVTQLHLRGCAERSVCVAFLNELQRAQLLRSDEPRAAEPSSAPAPALPGLFARIRRRLGLLPGLAS
ncbi:hypothetical protein [Variovorax sp. LT1R16]|uniref:hypothetical protein n=1 Tax=Variovorax sp. LT1R16 TaxID=3443728 RepID=UPI003F45DF3D